MVPVSRYEAVELIKKWGVLFDLHASPEAVFSHTIGDDFVIAFEDIEMVGIAGLREHDETKEQFYDELHFYYDHDIEHEGDPLVLTTRMIWDTWRRRSDGHGEHLIADLRHRWTLTRRADGRPVFQRHELLSLDYRDGYGPSESDSENLHIDKDRVGMGSSSRQS